MRVTMLHISCRDKSESNDLESVIYEFLTTSFKSRQVYIVSPWLSDFELKRFKIIYYPYVSTRSTREAIRALTLRRTDVHVATRCFDFLDVSRISLINSLINEGPSELPSSVRDSLIREIDGLLNRTITLMEFASIPGIDIKFDVEGKLHSKVYVNDNLALMGSANFTYSGIYYNLECLLKIEPGTTEYQFLRKYVSALVNQLEDYGTCVKTITKSFQEVLKIEVEDMRDITNYLQRIRERIAYNVS